MKALSPKARQILLYCYITSLVCGKHEHDTPAYEVQIRKIYKLTCIHPEHNIIQIQNNVMRDWQYSTKYSHIRVIILPVPHNIVLDMNNVMNYLCDNIN